MNSTSNVNRASGSDKFPTNLDRPKSGVTTRVNGVDWRTIRNSSLAKLSNDSLAKSEASGLRLTLFK